MMNEDTSEFHAEMSGQKFRHFVNCTRQLVINKHRSDFKLGELLHIIRTQGLSARWPRTDRQRPGYSNLEEMCDKEFGYSLSKANNLASNWKKLSKIELDESGDTFARCMRLGWSKLNVLLRIANDEGNLVAWLNDIDGKNLSELQLRGRIEEARRMHAEENVATGEVIDESDPEEPLGPANPDGYVPYEMRFEDQAGLDTFTQAVESIRHRYDQNIGMGKCVTMMAVQYLATVPSEVEGGAAVEVENLIRMIEASYGIRLEVTTAPPRRRRRRRTTADESL